MLLGALLFQGLSGLAGGFGLAMDPSGAALQIPTEWLYGSPFKDYRIPGLILFIVLGVCPLFVLYGAVRRLSWSIMGVFGVGAALVIWITVEILIIGYHSSPPLQAIYGVLGFLIIALITIPSVKHHLTNTNRVRFNH